MKLSVIMPVYNEEDTIKEITNRVKQIDICKELIIVDDGSTDGTKHILKKIKGNKNNQIKVIYYNENRGKGVAVRNGINHTTGDVIIIQDADLEYDPNDYPKLLKPILDGEVEVVYGSRFKSKKGYLKQDYLIYLVHAFGNAGLTLITNLIYSANLTDMETCYKVFTRNALKKIGKLRAKQFDFEPEITAKFLKKGFKIKEVPINYYSRNFDDGKKITWRDGIKAFFVLVKYRFFD